MQDTSQDNEDQPIYTAIFPEGKLQVIPTAKPLNMEVIRQDGSRCNYYYQGDEVREVHGLPVDTFLEESRAYDYRIIRYEDGAIVELFCFPDGRVHLQTNRAFRLTSEGSIQLLNEEGEWSS